MSRVFDRTDYQPSPAGPSLILDVSAGCPGNEVGTPTSSPGPSPRRFSKWRHFENRRGEGPGDEVGWHTSKAKAGLSEKVFHAWVYLLADLTYLSKIVY